MFRLLLFVAIFIALDLYAFQAFKFLVKNSNLTLFNWIVTLGGLGWFVYQLVTQSAKVWPFLGVFVALMLIIYLIVRFTYREQLAQTVLYFGVTLFIAIQIVYHFQTGDRRSWSVATQFFMVALVVMLTSKLVLIMVLFGEDLWRTAQAGLSKLSGNHFQIPGRRAFVSQLALGLAAIPFAAVLYGVFKGRYNFKVLTHTLTFDDLPDAFDGYRITQISDIHSGSFDDKEKVAYAIGLINEQASDAILFTGDMVNNVAEEMLPYKAMFGTLSATDGIYSVLGNHDYGDYVPWESEEKKKANLEQLKAIQQEMGFELLLNEHRYIEKGTDRLAIVGVENWGAGGFKKAGDLNKAIKGIEDNDFKILMSHDPSHWEQEVISHPLHFHLTLSGHTHGMQFGIEIPGWFKWSPVKWRYTYWAGIYKEAKQYINVNRGFGYLAFPGRVGIWPEISVIELKKSKKKGEAL